VKLHIAVAAMMAWAAAAPLSASAQVGYPPRRSPYIDLEHTQEITLLAGYFKGGGDPAGVAPGSGPIIGAHYSWRVGGPAHLTSELAYIQSKRHVLDPAKPPATRDLGEKDWPLYTANVGLALSLTGAKSWHHIVPEVQGGIGFISDMKGKADVGGFKYGTRFALSWGAGVRYVPGGRFQLRADIHNRLNTISYPDAYFRSTTASVSPILTTDSKSVWKNNPALTLGVSYLFSR
jgi:hypothetical protein